MNLANQQLGTTVEKSFAARSTMLAIVATLAIGAGIATWLAFERAPFGINGGADAAQLTVSDPAYVEHRAGERGDAFIGSAGTISDPVYVELRKGEHQLSGGSAGSVSDPVYVELRKGEHQLSGGSAGTVSDPVYVEFRASERAGN